MDKWFAHTLQERQSNSSGKASGKGSSNSSTTEQRAKRPRIDSSASLVALTVAIGALSLETARKERLHSGGLFRTCLIPPQEFFNDPLQVSQSSNGADQSLDSVLNWTSLVLAVSQASLPQSALEAQKLLQQHAASSHDITALRDSVLLCRIVKNFDGKFLKILLWTDESLHTFC
ncbi:unnamed protein product [Polarella glacialis]|uniref:Uncharacterized protein n=1 Tax=Polarella glacialis TaxID=89957 RepID=A0A813FHQ9_POLGL|nr:unnamed protein product [Polarella glacialis]CAE8669663.1 unnamed protein product [Polarella glacialis]